MLCLNVRFSDVFADSTHSQKIYAAAEEKGGEDPACSAHRNSENQKYKEYKHGEKRRGRDEHPAENYHVDGLRAERGYAVPGKVQHFLNRIFAFAREAGAAFVIHNVAFKAQHGHHAPEKEIHFVKLLESLYGSPAHKAEICVIENYVCAEKLHNAVISLGGEALHESVAVPLVAHAVNNIAAFVKFQHHFVNGVDVVLKVRVDGDCGVAALRRGNEPCQ